MQDSIIVTPHAEVTDVCGLTSVVRKPFGRAVVNERASRAFVCVPHGECGAAVCLARQLTSS
eukprot:10722686-Prorocentrum_lima.AAC.1